MSCATPTVRPLMDVVGAGRVPAVAFVDSRNLTGDAATVVGSEAAVDVAGIIAALDLFGFDVIEVRVGLALAQRSRIDRADSDHAKWLKKAHEKNAELKVAVEQHSHGSVLEGAVSYTH